jgi:hypothetical protein
MKLPPSHVLWYSIFDRVVRLEQPNALVEVRSFLCSFSDDALTINLTVWLKRGVL